MTEEEKKIIDDAREIILLNKDLPEGMKVIEETMNSVYRYFKSTIKEANLRDPRLLEVFKLERLLKNDFLPLANEPVFNPEKKLEFPMSITSEEDCQQAMEYIVHQTRIGLSKHNDLKTAPLTSQCINTSSEVEKICDELGVAHFDFECDENLNNGIFHCFNVVSFDLPNGENKMYLIDCTYRQFFTYSDSFVERIGMPYNSGPNIGTFMMMDEGRKKMAETILTKGYIEFTPQVIKDYFDGFVFSGRNGKYYEQLGKPVIGQSDYEPHYSSEDYLYALNNGGLNEPHIGRQIGVLSSQITFENKPKEIVNSNNNSIK